MTTSQSSNYSNAYIAELLRSIAAAYLLKNENRFKIIAYEKAADSVEHLNRELKELWQEKKMDLVPGLGPSIRASLDEYFQNGKSEHFESVLKGIPQPVFILMRIPSIGPKKAFKMVEALHLEKSKDIITDLKKAAQEGLIASIPSFGEKSQTDVLEAISRYSENKQQEHRMPLPYAFAIAQEVITYLKRHPSVIRIDALGSLRRMVSTIGDVDIAVAIKGDDPQPILDHFVTYPNKIAIDNAGEKKASIIVPPNIRVDLRVQDLNNYGSMLQYFTGNKAHNIKLREYALKKQLSLSENGIKDMKTGKIKDFDSEEKFYEFLGLQYVPPEIREGANEIEIAVRHKLPHLVGVQDMKGDMHTHSSYDLHPSHDFGANSYSELVKKAESLGYEYIGFSDHNPKITGVPKEEIVTIMKKRKDDIEKEMSRLKTKVKHFISLETDILPSGELALPEEAIQYVDYIVVSVHSVFRMGAEEMTKRVLKALSYPKVKVLGHPTGRLLGKRAGYELDWSTIFEFVKKKDIAVEINSWPERLDLPDMLVKEGVEKGVKFIIDTDAHAIADMDNMFYGVSVAQRGWCTKSDIMNTMPYQEFKDWLL